MNSPIDPIVGRMVLNRYRVVRVLAHGGMGVLYLGRTEGAAGFSRPVVVKRILPHLIANPRMAGLFVREARILSELQHQGIVSILDFGEEDQAYIMVLEYVRGYDLGLWYRYMNEIGSLFAGDVALQIMIRVLDAIHYAHTYTRPDGHALEIVHRDISPGNILMDTEGHVKLLDFGIARFADDGGEYRTRSGEFKGKAAYTAPEVFRGKDATAQADIFSAGVVLYKVLTGFNPFEGENSARTMKKIMDFNPQPITFIRSDLKKDLDAVLAKALAKRPADRYKTALEFADGLRLCRRQSEEQANARLIADVQRDFLGEMPAKLGLEALSLLDAAWRRSNQDLAELVDSNQALQQTDGATSVGTPPSTEAQPKGAAARRSVAVTAGVAVIAVAALGMAAFSVLKGNGSDDGGPRFVVVQQPGASRPPPPLKQPDVVANPPTAAEGGQAGTAALPVEDNPEVTPPRKGNRKKPPEDEATGPSPMALSRSFRRHQGAIERCFADNAESIKGTPEVAIQFQVDATGEVRSANTVPDEVSATPLGDCLLNVARRTNFGNQSAAVSFQIPLKAHTADKP